MEEKKKKECPLHMAMNRRKFLKDMGKGAVVAVAGPALYPLSGCDNTNNPGGCGGNGETPQPPTDLEVIRISKPAAPAGTAKVSAVKKESIQTGVQRAIDLAGGLSDIRQGQKVIIKPNIVAASGSARPHTHPEVMRAVIQEIKKRTDASNITVGEASFMGGTSDKAQRCGIMDVINAEGVNFVAWDEDPGTEFVEIESDDMQFIGYNIQVPKSLVDGTYHHFINVPIIKNHTWQNAGFTCCIKSFVGTLNPVIRKPNPIAGTHEWLDLAKAVAEFNLTTPNITMNIVDAISPVMVGGPLAPTMKAHDAGLIIASKDRVAADSLSVAALRYYAYLDGAISESYQHIPVWYQPQITRAIELNLGRSPENIQCVHDGVDEIDGILAHWS